MSATKHIFVSYAHADAKTVDRVVEELQAAGYDVWIDRRRILGARLWRSTLVAAIDGAAAAVLALSPRSAASPHVRKELDLCDHYGKQVIPVRIAATEIPPDLLFQLVGIQIIDWDKLGSFEAVVIELRRSLDDLQVGRDQQGMGSEVSRPASLAFSRAPLAILGTAGILAAGALYGTEMWQQAASVVPASLTTLMPMPFSWVQGIGVAIVVLLAMLSGLAALFAPWKLLRPAFAGLGVFLTLTTSIALWGGQYLAAALGMLASGAICATWIRKSKTGLGRRPLIAHALILLVAVLAGVGVTQYQVADHARAASTIGIAPFEVDTDLKDLQADHSNSLRLKLSAVLVGAGLSVMPNLSFDARSIEDWKFDNWRISKVKELEPHLLLRTSLNRCGGPVQTPRYTWLAEPYAHGVEALPDFIRVSGSDPSILSVRMAFGILTSAPLANELGAMARQATRRIIVDDIRAFARQQQATAEVERAVALLRQPSIEDAEISELLERFNTDEGACDESAAASRNALAVRLGSYSPAGRSAAAKVAAP